MIGKLKGLIDSVAEDYLILDVHGVGYLVYGSQRLLAMCETGAAIELIIETHVREDHIHLYGFATTAERDSFRLLTTVQGVGVRMALAILGHYPVAQLQTILAAQDKKALTVVSGVGPKLAERIMTELKNKVTALPVSLAVACADTDKNAGDTHHNNIADDAVSALVNLGYGRSEAYQAVARVQPGSTDGLDALIRAGLRELSTG